MSTQKEITEDCKWSQIVITCPMTTQNRSYCISNLQGSSVLRVHKVKKPYIKRKGAGAAAPTGPAACLDTFMRDARTNAPSHAQSAAARAATREFKQKNILCMNVEIHRENYQAYVERKSIMDTQQQILYHLSGSQSSAPTSAPATTYSQCGVDCYNWTKMEMHLYSTPDA
jgi:hypothetical protein